MDKPCMGCTERHLGCHDHCERYKAMVAEMHAVDDVRKRYAKISNDVYVAVTSPGMNRWAKYKTRRSGNE